MSVIPNTEFGDRVRSRLRTETAVWLTTTGADGTPQPNPVWFLWDGADSVVVYSDHEAVRLQHIAGRPQVSLNFDGDGRGGDIVVIAATAEIDDTVPPADQNPEYLAKYEEWITRIGHDPAGFAARWSVPLRLTFRKVRGH
jgi:PPOX class probable F420-dependent enzyme